MAIVRMHKLDGTGAIKAFVDLSVEEALVIKGFKIVEGDKGLFVSMPSELGRDGKYYQSVVALTREVKDEIEKMILEAYEYGAGEGTI